MTLSVYILIVFLFNVYFIINVCCLNISNLLEKEAPNLKLKKVWIENKFLVMKTLFDFGFNYKTGKENKCQFSTINTPHSS